MLTFQQIILQLQDYWGRQGCALLQPYDMEVGAGTSHTATFLRALGPEPDVEVDTYTLAGREGDVFLICSDGLTSMIADDEVSSILRSAGSLDGAADELIRAANQSGGKDNITVILFRLGEGEG